MSNWLDYRRFKQHGIRDKRWLIEDRNLVMRKMNNLRKRDLRVLQYEAQRATEASSKQLSRLKKGEAEVRLNLNKAMVGNKVLIEYTLGTHPSLYRANAHLPPAEIIENIEQAIFNKRKMRDRLAYQKRKLMAKYKDDLLVFAFLENEAVVYGQRTRVEEQIQTISNTIQAAKIRKLAAISIFHVYKTMHKILFKDSIYYDAVVRTLQNDQKDQSKMLMDTIEMGQTVAELLNDLITEENQLQIAMKMNMATRQRSLNLFNGLVQKFSKHYKNLTRRDSSILLPFDHNPPKSKEEQQLIEESTFVDKTLDFLKCKMKVANYEELLPALEEQLFQEIRLHKFAQILSTYKNKLNHLLLYGSVLGNVLKHTYNEKQIEYLEKERNLLKRVNKEYKKDYEMNLFYKENGNLMLMIRMTFDHLCEKMKNVYEHGQLTRVPSYVSVDE